MLHSGEGKVKHPYDTAWYDELACQKFLEMSQDFQLFSKYYKKPLLRLAIKRFGCDILDKSQTQLSTASLFFPLCCAIKGLYLAQLKLVNFIRDESRDQVHPSSDKTEFITLTSEQT